MEDLEKTIKKFYTEYGESEWKRLEKSFIHRLEFITTKKYLDKYLPAEGLVLDAGGGPGRYTIELAKRGYDVILLDLTPKQLEIAREKIEEARVESNVKKVIEGDIKDLSQFDAGTFDSVLCLGAPLSHIVSDTGQMQAVKELKNVAKQGAPIFISVKGRLEFLIRSINGFPAEICQNFFTEFRDTGKYPGGHGLGPMHMFRRKGFTQLVAASGLDVITEVGLEGLASTQKQSFNKVCRNNKEVWNAWKQTHFKTCELPSVVDISKHMLIVARKPREKK